MEQKYGEGGTKMTCFQLFFKIPPQEGQQRQQHLQGHQGLDKVQNIVLSKINVSCDESM